MKVFGGLEAEQHVTEGVREGAMLADISDDT